jgi:mono/diheme cytochrome c family protein
MQDIEDYLKTGSNRFGRVVGSMRDVISVSTSRWTDDDRRAVATYLKSLPPPRTPAVSKPDANAMRIGETVFVERCSSCHLADRSDYPSLAHNSIVQAIDATTVVRVILRGSQSAAIKGRPTGFSMPAFAVLSDKQLAGVATYIRNSWGNRAGPVKADAVRSLREALKGRS